MLLFFIDQIHLLVTLENYSYIVKLLIFSQIKKINHFK